MATANTAPMAKENTAIAPTSHQARPEWTSTCGSFTALCQAVHSKWVAAAAAKAAPTSSPSNSMSMTMLITPTSTARPNSFHPRRRVRVQDSKRRKWPSAKLMGRAREKRTQMPRKIATSTSPSAAKTAMRAGHSTCWASNTAFSTSPATPPPISKAINSIMARMPDTSSTTASQNSRRPSLR